MSRRLNDTVVVWAVVITALDAATKAWARSALASGARHVVGPLWWRLSYNSGLSFSVSTKGASWATLITAAIAVGVLVGGLRARAGQATAGFGLLLGGGVANVIDRLSATPHVVTDFVAVGAFPVFNLADVAITAGFVVLLVASLRGEPLWR